MARSDLQIGISSAPIVGQEAWVTVSDGRPAPGITVTATLRPGLTGESEVTIGITDGLGRVRYTPERAGLAEIHAADAVLPVSIGWSDPPSATVTLLFLLFAAALLAIGYGAMGGPRWRQPGKPA